MFQEGLHVDFSFIEGFCALLKSAQQIWNLQTFLNKNEKMVDVVDEHLFFYSDPKLLQTCIAEHHVVASSNQLLTVKIDVFYFQSLEVSETDFRVWDIYMRTAI